MEKKTLNNDYFKTFKRNEYDFETKLEMAYIIGKEKLDHELNGFVFEETYCDGITVFSYLVIYLYEKYLENGCGGVYEFLKNNFDELYEQFKKECFIGGVIKYE